MKKFIKVIFIFLYMLSFVNMHVLLEWNVIFHQIIGFISEANQETGLVDAGEDYMIQDKPIYQEGEDWVGSYGDINIIYEAVTPIVGFYVGGHAAVIEDENQSIETTGLDPPGQNFVKYRVNNWAKRHDFVIGLRVVGADEEDYHEAVAGAKTTLGKPYDYIFYLINQSFYCTEVITAGWDPLGYHLNYDGGAVTVQDLMVSPLTYVSYIHYTDKDGNKVVFHLKE
ncbi:hypothetical protein [Vallitalea okinawensis]|uniref:hypothetical protein n=1 Tax=Vallitalea okinawensis TaxID=2078660 RepID=UPI000CFC1C5A|nr:hypothetical protein [Vallitalea okinawensis]